MAPQFLALKHRGTGSPEVLTYVGATPTALPASFGSLEVNGGVSADSEMSVARVVQFRGPRTLYTVLGDDIWRSTDGGTTFTSVHTLTNVDTLSLSKAGPFVLYAGGTPTLVVIYKSTGGAGNEFSVARSTDGTTWTTVGPFASGQAGAPSFLSPVLWRGVLYMILGYSSGTSKLLSYAVSNNTVAFTNSPFDSSTKEPTALCVFLDRLFALGFNSGGSITLEEFAAGSFSTELTLEASGVTACTGRYAMFVQGSSLFAVYYRSTVDGWRFQEIVDTGGGALGASDTTANVRPTLMGSTPPATGRVGVLVDGETTPGAAPEVTLYYATDGDEGTLWNTFTWTDNATLAGDAGAPDDTGGSAAHAMPFLPWVQGSTYWTDGELHIELVGVRAVFDAMEVSFSVQSVSGTEPVKVKGWFALASQAYPTNVMTIVSPSDGTIAANENTGLTADGNTRTVDWKVFDDGLTNGQFVSVILRVSAE